MDLIGEKTIKSPWCGNALLGRKAFADMKKDVKLSLGDVNLIMQEAGLKLEYLLQKACRCNLSCRFSNFCNFDYVIQRLYK